MPVINGGVRMSYKGSKGQAGTWQRIIGQMPPHNVYVEPFAGSALIFRRKRPARINVLIDASRSVSASLGAGIPQAIVLHADALAWLAAPALVDGMGLTLGPDALVYCDPPYLLETRQGRLYYEHELSDGQHAQLLALLQGLKCKVLLSGYPSALYNDTLKGWRCISYQARHHRKTATECLWANFPEPDELHDWRFAGRSYRERLSLNRLAARWQRRLDAMPARKRGFVLHAIAAGRAQSGAAGLHSQG